MAEHLYTYIDPPRERDLMRSCALLENDGVIAIPTDVGWAFACDASNPRAIDKIRLLKPHHPKEQPFSLICSSISMASEFTLIDNTIYPYLKKAWPGAYTIILSRTKAVARQLKDKRSTVGIRIPNHKLVLALVTKFGKPLATTTVPSVNEQPMNQGFEVFENFQHGIDLLLDLGEDIPALETTIIDFTDGSPKLIRKGLGETSIFGIAS